MKPINDIDTVLKKFWVDNFDINVEKQTGGGAVNITHLVIFQEPNEFAAIESNNVSLEHLKKKITLQVLVLTQKRASNSRNK